MTTKLSRSSTLCVVILLGVATYVVAFPWVARLVVPHLNDVTAQLAATQGSVLALLPLGLLATALVWLLVGLPMLPMAIGAHLALRSGR